MGTKARASSRGILLLGIHAKVLSQTLQLHIITSAISKYDHLSHINFVIRLCRNLLQVKLLLLSSYVLLMLKVPTTVKPSGAEEDCGRVHPWPGLWESTWQSSCRGSSACGSPHKNGAWAEPDASACKKWTSQYIWLPQFGLTFRQLFSACLVLFVFSLRVSAQTYHNISIVIMHLIAWTNWWVGGGQFGVLRKGAAVACFQEVKV